ncbi:Altered inheritance of mitochondria protein 6 [Hypocenomyce scalaris]|nr:Altered inheritance of mitochondria protein 6 [Hypocenomyce scalaris]
MQTVNDIEARSAKRTINRQRTLYDALVAGCTGVEADVHLVDGDLLVGHNTASLTPDTATVPLPYSLMSKSTAPPPPGPVVLQQLEPFRSRGWLTSFNGTDVLSGPITVVGSGNTPFDLLNANTAYRDTFFDAL